MKNSHMSRRGFLAFGGAASASALAGCVSTPPPALDGRSPIPASPPASVEPGLGSHASMYGSVYDAGFQIPAIPFDKVAPRLRRQIVPDPTGEAPGTLIVDTANHYIYFVRRNREAVRYGVGLGRAGFEWSGRGVIQWKQPWPKWFPPDEMIDRQPELEKYRASYDKTTDTWLGGMDGGPSNPLGARAMYIFQNGKDTLYRVHGSPEWWSIGKSVSSGCVRLMNQDVIDLYDRVREGAPIVVTSGVGSV